MTGTNTKAQCDRGGKCDRGGMCMIIGAAAGLVITLPLLVGAALPLLVGTFNSTSDKPISAMPKPQSDVMILGVPQGGIILPMPVPVPLP